MSELDKNQVLYQVYLEERKALIEAEQNSSQLFDKSIITLTAGVFGLSIAFVRYLTPSPKHTGFLLLCWVFFCLSLLSILLSFLTSQLAFQKQRILLEEEFFNEQTHNTIQNTYGKLTKVFNYSSIVGFILGVILLLVFTSYNLNQGGSSMANNTKGIVHMEEHGMVPPSSPVKPPSQPQQPTPTAPKK